MQTDLRIAVICLGHLGNPTGVQFLARYFKYLPARIFLHVDAKADIQPYAAACGSLSNVEILADRHSVYWGGFSLNRTTIEIIRRLLADESWTHFLYLSEDSLPILPASTFAERLLQGGEYLLSYPAGPQGQARYDGFFYFDSQATNPRDAALLERSFTDTDFAAIERLAALKQRGKAKVRLHGGPGWFGLSRLHVETVVRSYTTDVHMRESFEFTSNSVEHYIHTILASYGEFKMRLTYDDFARDPKPYVFRDPEELTTIDGQGAPFVRKIALDEPSIFEWAQQFVC